MIGFQKILGFMFLFAAIFWYGKLIDFLTFFLFLNMGLFLFIDGLSWLYDKLKVKECGLNK